MTAQILQFARRIETDVNALCVDILACLAENSRGVDRDAVVNAFRKAHPDLKPAELIAAINLSIKILLIFQRLVLNGDRDDPEGAA